MIYPREVRNDYTDPDNFTHIDAWFSDDENEEGRTVAIVCNDTGKVYFIDNAMRNNRSVLEAIKDATAKAMVDSKELSGTVYSLCEAVADIAFIAGLHKYYGGDSREDVSNFILWAREFEEKWKGKKWGEEGDEDYIEEVTKFAYQKIS